MEKLNFKEFFEQNTVGKHNDYAAGAYLNSAQTGHGGWDQKANPLNVPNLELGLPQVTKTGMVTHVERTKNPIAVFLSDGTRLFFSYDEFRRIKGCEPTPGRTLIVTFQRHPNNQSEHSSQIDKCRCY